MIHEGSEEVSDKKNRIMGQFQVEGRQCVINLKEGHYGQRIVSKEENVEVGGGASLVAQWLRICLSMQGTWVRALVWEDATCRGATRSVSHNY